MNNQRPTWPEYFFDIARVVATRSTCLRKQHGSVIERDRAILGTGFNGSAAGTVHCTDIGCARGEAAPGTNYTKCRASHSEANAIIQAAKHGVSVNKATIYVTGVPCIGCARAIINAGIIEVHCLDDGRYEYDEVMELFSEANIRVNIYKV